MRLRKQHLYLNVHQEINAIIAPLSVKNISYFCYVKSYADGSRLFLVNHPDDLNAYLSNKHYLIGNCEAKPDLYQNQAVLWSTLKQQHLYQFSREHFNIDHGMTLINQHEDHCEFFAFASSPEHPETMNLYLNHLDIFQAFTHEFKEKASKLIEKAEKHQIILPFNEPQIPPVNMLDIEFNEKNTRKNIDKKQVLSEKELELIPLLIAGYTAKEIAVQLHKSYRTIEGYVDSIKNKLHVRNKTELIAKLIQFKHH